MLFTFTNLERLAFQIEEAINPYNYESQFKVGKSSSQVRRSDLIAP